MGPYKGPADFFYPMGCVTFGSPCITVCMLLDKAGIPKVCDTVIPNIIHKFM
jgi:hypothetical protein